MKVHMTRTNETTGTPPFTLSNLNKESLEDYRIYGQSVQDGTPTPSNPVEVQSVGERTVNLLNVNDPLVESGVYYTARGTYNEGSNNLRLTPFIEIPDRATNLTYSGVSTQSMSSPSTVFFDEDKQFISGFALPIGYNTQFEKNYTVPANAKYIRTEFRDTYTNLQLELGSTATAYEPYGYKVPVTATKDGNTITTNIYLDEPLRGIGTAWDYIDFKNQKRVNAIGNVDLGSLSWERNDYNTVHVFRCNKPRDMQTIEAIGRANAPKWKTSRYIPISYNSSWVNEKISMDSSSRVVILDNSFNEATTFTTALSGVPLYYELATPTEQPITLPSVLTQNPNTILGVMTTIQPSSMYAKYSQDYGAGGVTTWGKILDERFPRLPSEYQEVEWIGSSGTQYIDTGITPTVSQGREIEYEYGSTFFKTTNGTDKCIGGIRNNGFTIKLPNTNGSNFEVADPFLANTSEFSVQMNTLYNYTAKSKYGEQSYTVNNNTHTRTGTYSGTIDFGDATICIFALGFLPQPKWFFDGRIYNVWYKENGVWKFNLIPCYRKSDSEPGMYDLVNGVFYTNSGTGTFTKGPGILPKKMKIARPLVFNQLVQNGNFESASGWIARKGNGAVANNTYSLTVSSDSYSRQFRRGDVIIVIGHKYYCSFMAKVVSDDIKTTTVRLGSAWGAGNGDAIINSVSLTSDFMSYSGIRESTKSGSDIWFSFCNSVENDVLQVKNVMLIDLTAMYGAGNEPTTVEQVKADCLALGHNLDEYQPYCAPKEIR